MMYSVYADKGGIRPREYDTEERAIEQALEMRKRWREEFHVTKILRGFDAEIVFWTKNFPLEESE